MGHTPGPWHANKDCIEIDGPEGPRDVTLAVVIQPDNAAADAQLIAAAPELLKVARMAIDYANDTKDRFGVNFDGDDAESYDNLMDAADAAIANAEGRTK